MDQDDKERFNRQLILTGFGDAAQQKLADAKVLVIGAGGLGCPALQYLVAAGVGTIGIADNDVVSLSNLHRQVLYSTADIGLSKVAVALAKLSLINPATVIHTYAIKVQNSNALDIIAAYDIVIDGTDNFASRYLINDACVLLHKPLVFGAVLKYQGQLAVFNVAGSNGPTINYRDLFPQPPKRNEVPDCAEAGVLGVLPGIIGTMQAAEVIKLITGTGTPLVNKVVTYNGLTNQLYEMNVVPPPVTNAPLDQQTFLKMDYDSFCNMKEKEQQVIEIDAEQMQTLRKNPSAIVIDVRELHELPAVTTFPHRKIPMSVFQDAIEDLEEHTIILFCQHGIRSLNAAVLLQERYGASKKLFSLKGGISRWAGELLQA